MNVTRFVAVGCALGLVSVSACSDSSSGEDGGDKTPFAFLSGNYGMGVSPRFSNCGGEVYFPREVWVVSSYFGSVSVMTTPEPSTSPQPVNAITDAGSSPSELDAGLASSQLATAGSQDGGASSQVPAPSFTGLMSSTLQWAASKEEPSSGAAGCLKRRTTLLNLQFTPDSKVMGVRSVIDEYAGGVDCPSDCRMIFDVQGAVIKH